MPRIPTFDAGTDVPQPTDRGISTASQAAQEENRFARESGQALGGAVSKVGGQAGKQMDAENFQRAQQAANFADAQIIGKGAATSSQLYANLTQNINDAVNSSDPTDHTVGTGLRAGVQQDIEKWRDSVMASNSSEKVQNWALSRADQMTEHLNNSITAHEMTRAAGAFEENVRQKYNADSKTVALDPSQLDNIIAGRHIDASAYFAANSVTPEARTQLNKMMAKGDEQLAADAIRGIAQTNPSAAEVALSDPKFTKYISADDQKQLLGYVQTQRRVQDYDKRQATLEEKQQKADASADRYAEYMNKTIDNKTGRVLMPSPKLNQQILNDPNMLQKDKNSLIIWNETQYQAQRRIDKENAAGAAASDNPVAVLAAKGRIHDDTNPLNREQLQDLVTAGQMTPKTAAMLALNVSARDATDRAFDKKYSTVLSKRGKEITGSLDFAGQPDAAARSVNDFDEENRRIIAQTPRGPERDALMDPSQPKKYLFNQERMAPFLGSQKDRVAAEADTKRVEARQIGGAPKLEGGAVEFNGFRFPNQAALDKYKKDAGIR